MASLCYCECCCCNTTQEDNCSCNTCVCGANRGYRCVLEEPLHYYYEECQCFPIPRLTFPSMIYEGIKCPHRAEGKKSCEEKCTQTRNAAVQKTADNSPDEVSHKYGGKSDGVTALASKTDMSLLHLEEMTNKEKCPRQVPYTAPPYGVAAPSRLDLNRRMIKEGRVEVRTTGKAQPVLEKKIVQSAPARLAPQCVNEEKAVTEQGTIRHQKQKVASAPQFTLIHGQYLTARGKRKGLLEITEEKSVNELDVPPITMQAMTRKADDIVLKNLRTYRYYDIKLGKVYEYNARTQRMSELDERDLDLVNGNPTVMADTWTSDMMG